MRSTGPIDPFRIPPEPPVQEPIDPITERMRRRIEENARAAAVKAIASEYRRRGENTRHSALGAPVEGVIRLKP